MCLSNLGAVSDDFLRGDEAHLAVALLGHQDHALGLDAADGAGGEVREDADLLAQHVLRAVVFGNAGDDGAGIDARVDGEFQQLVGLGDAFGLEDRGGTDVHRTELVKSDFVLLRLDLLRGLLGSLGGLGRFALGLDGREAGDLRIHDAVLDLLEQ